MRLSPAFPHHLFPRTQELALEWLESQRAIMYDASKADYFLQYGWQNGAAHGNGTIYNEGRAEGDQFFCASLTQSYRQSALPQP